MEIHAHTEIETMSIERKPVIWIINEAGHPYHKALDLVPNGELKRFTQGNVNTLRLDRMNYSLAEGIAKYAHEDDFLIVSGTPMIPMMVGILWFLRFDSAKFLQWNAKKREYELTSVTREDLERLLDSFMTP